MNWYGLSKEAHDQSTSESYVADYLRYVADSYTAKVAFTPMDDAVTVSVSLFHTQLGGIHYQDFWKFDISESKKARKTYEKVASIVDGVVNSFIGTENPTSSMYSQLREELRHVNKENKPSTRVLWVDRARDHDGEKDWRSSIYGTRYPKASGF